MRILVAVLAVFLLVKLIWNLMVPVIAKRAVKKDTTPHGISVQPFIEIVLLAGVLVVASYSDMQSPSLLMMAVLGLGSIAVSYVGMIAIERLIRPTRTRGDASGASHENPIDRG